MAGVAGIIFAKKLLVKFDPFMKAQFFRCVLLVKFVFEAQNHRVISNTGNAAAHQHNQPMNHQPSLPSSDSSISNKSSPSSMASCGPIATTMLAGYDAGVKPWDRMATHQWHGPIASVSPVTTWASSGAGEEHRSSYHIVGMHMQYMAIIAVHMVVFQSWLSKL